MHITAQGPSVSEMTYTVSSGTVGTLNSIIPYHTCGATLYQKVEIFAILGPRLHPWHRLAPHFARPSGPTCPWALPNFTWIGATSRPCWAKMLIFDLWVNLNTGWRQLPAGKKHNLEGNAIYWHDVMQSAMRRECS